MRFFGRYCLICCFLLAAACSDDPKDDNNKNNSKTDTDIVADTGTDTDETPDIDETPDTELGIDTPEQKDAEPDAEPEIDGQETDTPITPDTCPDGTIDVNGDASRCLDQAQIATGTQSSCAITTEGTLYCWGHNFDDPALPHLTAQQVGTDESWQSISAGADHICGVNAGQLFCWGANAQGQLGIGSQGPEITKDPTQIGTDDNWAIVSAGNKFTCAIQAGELLCWGSNSHGQLGNGPTDQLLEPTPVVKPAGTTDNWTHITTGLDHTCAIQAGELYCWGHKNFGKLGDDSDQDQSEPTRIGTENTWTDISAGAEHTCGIQANKLFCWGYNNAAQLGIEGTTNEKTPRQVDEVPLWVSVTTGDAHSCAIDTSGVLFCWGRNSNGQIGDGTTTNVPTPKSIIIHESYSAVSAAENHTCAIRNIPGANGDPDQKAFYCWGENNDGVLGNASAQNKQTAPTHVGTLDGWDQISTNEGHTCAIRSGELYCWGSNINGRLGIDEANSFRAETPTKIGTHDDWTHISAGHQNTCGVRNAELYCWGAYQNGALATEGLTTAQRTPLRIGTETGWTTAAANHFNGCAIRAGELYCWGFNVGGVLGNGTTDESKTPTRVGTDTDWQTVSMGRAHTCAIRAGKLYCWGSGTHGALGNGSNTSSNVPLQIGTESDWTDVATGNARTCATRNAETYCWGKAPIGDQTNTAQNTPTKVSADKTATDVTTSANHTCAIWNGNLFCWGNNSSYQLGTTDVAETDTPIQIGTQNDWTQLTSHTNQNSPATHTCGLREGGQIFCWGDNALNQLGVPKPLSPQAVVGF